MGEAVVIGIGVPVSGYEEDYLDLLDHEFGDHHLGLCGLLRLAGADSIDWSHVTAFEHALYPEPDKYGMSMWTDDREEFRQQTGRKFPKLYRVCVKVQIEEVPDEEAEKLWQARAEYLQSPKDKNTDAGEAGGNEDRHIL